MERNKDARCDNCPFWNGPSPLNERLGQCVRLPRDRRSHITETFSDDYCGEHPDFFGPSCLTCNLTAEEAEQLFSAEDGGNAGNTERRGNDPRNQTEDNV